MSSSFRKRQRKPVAHALGSQYKLKDFSMQHIQSNLYHSLKILLIALALGTTSHAFAADIPIENSGFETTGNTIANWQIADGAGSKTQSTIVSSLARTGKNSLHINKTNRLGYVMVQSEKIPVTVKGTYEVNAWLNTKTASQANVYFMISQFKANGEKKDSPDIFGNVKPLYSTGNQWEKLQQFFTVREGVDRVQISLIFSAAPIDVHVDDIQLKSLLGDYKPRYEEPVPEELLPLEEAQKVLQARPRATATVKQIGQRPRLFIDGKASFPAFYVAPAWKGTNAQIKDFKQAGVNVYFIPYILGKGVYGDLGVWSGKDKTDFSELDEMMWRILRADPQGYIMFYLMTDPYPSWAAEHPQSIVTNQDGKKAIVDMKFLRWGDKPKVEPGKTRPERYGHSYVSTDLRRDTKKVLAQFDQYIKNSLPGKAVIGYNVGGGYDGQMIGWSDAGGANNFGDYSEASRDAFRGWLKAKYQTEAALQAAWQQPQVTFETAQVPSAKRRLESGFFLDPKTEQDIADYNRFHSEGIVDTLDEYAKALRESHDTPIILGAYYAGPRSTKLSHHATGYLLRKGSYNYVTSVMAYKDFRLPGGAGQAHQIWQSHLLHNTFGLSEQDFRSWKSKPSTAERNHHVGRVETAEESNAVIRRDTGRAMAYGQGNWWYDMSGGWFSDPSIMKAVKESVNAYQLDLKDNNFPRTDVAIFTDEESIDYLNPKNAVGITHAALNKQITPLNSSGVPFHLYLQNDISVAKLPEYKMYVFLNAYHLTADQWEAIQKLRRDGKTICFIHAPGVTSQQLLGAPNAAAAIEKVTGIKVAENGTRSSQLEPRTKSTFDGGNIISYNNITIPTFAVDDSNAQVVADYTANRKPAVAIRDFGNWRSVFFGGVGMDAFFFNALAREAGAWVAAPAGNAVYGNQNFLTIHALHSGSRSVQLLQPSKVTDLADGKVISAKTQTLDLNMQRGETRWFYLQQP